MKTCILYLLAIFENTSLVNHLLICRSWKIKVQWRTFCSSNWEVFSIFINHADVHKRKHF